MCGLGLATWPRAGSASNDNLHYDTAKLRQWEIVFAHAQKLGIFLHFVFNEAEEANKRELDDGELGPERMLFYREMIARFGHHVALQWNLCEEYNLQFDFGADRVRAFADYIRTVRPIRSSGHGSQRRRSRQAVAVHFRRSPFLDDVDPIEPAADTRRD